MPYLDGLTEPGAPGFGRPTYPSDKIRRACLTGVAVVESGQREFPAIHHYNDYVATAADSVTPREETLSAAPIRLSPLQTWHLLSLDAPTVAALWSWFFARAMRIDLPWHAPLLLALGTWLIYVTDRLLDAHHPSPNTPLHRRHRFHAEHRRAFVGAAVAGASVLLWLIYRMTPAARHEDSVLFLIALLYLGLVHNPLASKSGTNAGSWLPKELAVGIVFSAACAVPAWSRLQTGHAILLPAIAVFAALCWLNCVSIERWENLPLQETAQAVLTASHPTTRWAADHLRPTALGLAALAGALAADEWLRTPSADSPEIALAYLAALIAALGFAVLDKYRERFSTMGLRIAADAVLLTPLLFLPFLG